MMVLEESERLAVQVTIIAMFIVLLAGAYSLFFKAGLGRLDLTGSLFFIFTLATATVSLVLAFRNARYAAVTAFIALLLALMVFGSCVLGWTILGLTC